MSYFMEYREQFETRRRIEEQQLGNAVLKFAIEQGNPQAPEIFDTVQGEGRNIGQPTAFARLSNCNLACSWCDTPYTWAFTDKLAEAHDEGVRYDKGEQQIEVDPVEAARQIHALGKDRLVITGGEPMMQQGQIVTMIDELKCLNPNQKVEIETNGTIPPTADLLSVVDQFNVSVKLNNSGNIFAKRIKPKAIATFAAIPNADFKFVASSEEDIPEILEIVNSFDIPHERVFLMPEGRTPEEVEAHQQALVELCKQHNFNLTTRLHVLLWGAKRGV